MFTRIHAGLALCAALWAVPAVADDGHNHDAAPAAAAGPALPRFAAAAGRFELVGIVNARQLTVYLDRFDDNSPVEGASIELEVGGAPVSLEEHAEGEFEGTLAHELESGTTQVRATITVGSEVRTVGAELDVHEESPQQAASPIGWQRYAAWTALAALLALCAAWVGRRAGMQRARLGGAA